MSTETPDVTEQCCPCSTVRVTTTNVPRDIVDAYELTAAERGGLRLPRLGCNR